MTTLWPRGVSTLEPASLDMLTCWRYQMEGFEEDVKTHNENDTSSRWLTSTFPCKCQLELRWLASWKEHVRNQKTLTFWKKHLQVWRNQGTNAQNKTSKTRKTEGLKDHLLKLGAGKTIYTPCFPGINNDEPHTTLAMCRSLVKNALIDITVAMFKPGINTALQNGCRCTWNDILLWLDLLSLHPHCQTWLVYHIKSQIAAMSCLNRTWTKIL